MLLDQTYLLPAPFVLLSSFAVFEFNVTLQPTGILKLFRAHAAGMTSIQTVASCDMSLEETVHGEALPAKGANKVFLLLMHNDIMLTEITLLGT